MSELYTLAEARLILSTQIQEPTPDDVQAVYMLLNTSSAFRADLAGAWMLELNGR